jgi:hypothetical protein
MVGLMCVIIVLMQVPIAVLAIIICSIRRRRMLPAMETQAEVRLLEDPAEVGLLEDPAEVGLLEDSAEVGLLETPTEVGYLANLRRELRREMRDQGIVDYREVPVFEDV